MKPEKFVLTAILFGVVLSGGARAWSTPVRSTPLPALPPNLPAWLDNTDTNHLFRKRGAHNYDVYNIAPLARDLTSARLGTPP